LIRVALWAMILVNSKSKPLTLEIRLQKVTSQIFTA
jgi:hypothetical protein